MTVRFEIYDDPDRGLWLLAKAYNQLRWQYGFRRGAQGSAYGPREAGMARVGPRGPEHQ